MQRLLQAIAERMAMNAFVAVHGYQRIKWYRNPIQWIGAKLLRLTWFGLIALSLLWTIFSKLLVPLLIVCMFITLHRMNDKLEVINDKVDGLYAEVANETDTAIVIEWIRGKIDEIENAD